jgi:hypothetical protein
MQEGWERERENAYIIYSLPIFPEALDSSEFVERAFLLQVHQNLMHLGTSFVELWSLAVVQTMSGLRSPMTTLS